MNRKYVLAALLVAIAATSVQAGWRDFRRRSALDYQRNNAWPQPWVNTDRLSSCHIFDLMAQNGWCQQSTLTSFHFNPSTNQLTEAGELKVRQIMTQHPSMFQTLFVVMGNDEHSTANRIDSVQQLASRISPNGYLPEVRRVAVSPRGWPAEEIDAIGRKLYDSIPAPRLGEAQAAGYSP